MNSSSRPTRPARRLSALLLAAIAGISCSGPNKPDPPPPPSLSITAVSPSSVSTGGGTAITVTGTNFSADARIFVDSLALTNITVTGTTSITGTTPAHAAGGAILSVTSGGATAAFSGSFIYVAPSGANAKPVISQIRTTGPRTGQPPAFANVGDAIAVVATVSDSETAASQLAYSWTATAGSITGTSASATWTAPSTLTFSPASATITLTVTETFTESGLVHQQSTTSSAVMIVHDTTKEMLDMGEDFLRLFSLQQRTPDEVLHNFSDNTAICDGRNAEKGDVEHNQATFRILSFSITRLTPVDIAFGALWPPYPNLRADANSRFRVHWESRPLAGGAIEIVDGIDWVTGVLDANTWRLCHSSFTADPQSAASTIAGISPRKNLIRRF